MDPLLFPQMIKRAKRTHFPLENQLYQRIEEKILRDRITRTTILSERENNVAVYLAKGYDLDEISDKLCISPETVDTHKKHIYSKLNIHRHHDLLAWYIISILKR
jgi:DNA-binding CsgD family transcriptional regulator